MYCLLSSPSFNSIIAGQAAISEVEGTPCSSRVVSGSPWRNVWNPVGWKAGSMVSSGRSEDVAAVRRSLEDARSERARLAKLGRWSEADEAALSTLRDVLAAASPDIDGRELGGLVYVAGSPRAPRQQVSTIWGPVPAERLSATYAMLLVNRGSEPQAVVELARRALKSYGWRDLGTFWYAVLALAYVGEEDVAQSYLDLAVERSGWHGAHAHSDALVVLRARVAGLSGEPAVACRLLGDALKRGVVAQFTEVAVAWSIISLVDLGEFDRADDLLRSNGFDHTLDAVTDRAEVFAARGALREATGRPQLAYEDFVACGRELSGWGMTNPAVIAWRSQAALCAAATDRRSLALSMADEELFRARRWGTPRVVGTALRAVALVSEEGTDVELLKEAVELLSRGRARNLQMRAQYELGVKLSLRAQIDAGRAVLKGARDTATSMGSKIWVDRVDAALRRCEVAGTEGTLTSQELKVLNLALAGLGNKEIAARLHLVNSTVEFHLSNVYRKLGISGRSELRSIMVPVL
jgi:DNA-binding NarL/FixJ family response regulator